MPAHLMELLYTLYSRWQEAPIETGRCHLPPYNDVLAQSVTLNRKILLDFFIIGIIMRVLGYPVGVRRYVEAVG